MSNLPSRKKVLSIAAAALATGALLPFARLALPWVRDVSGAPLVDLAIITGWGLTAIAASWLQVAAAVGTGERAGDRSEEASASPLGAWALLRSALVVVALLANLYWSNALAGDFWFAHYARIGVNATALRAAAPEDRRRAIARIAEMGDPSLVDAVGRLAALKDDPDEAVRADAVAALGHVARRMRVAVAMLQAEGGVGGRWEPHALEVAKAALGDPVAGIRSTTGLVRRAWLRSAGAIGETTLVPILGAVVEDPKSSREDVLQAIWALAEVPGTEVLDELRPALDSEEAEVRTHAAWAVAVAAASSVRGNARGADHDPAFVAMESHLAAALPRLGLQAACAYLGVFPKIADARLTPALIRIALSPDFTARCVRVERPAWFGRPDVVVADGPLSDLVLAAMTSIAVGNEELRRFLEAAAANEGYPPATRERMKAILQQL